MKHNFKKIISLVLTAVMILGTMSALVPFMASAEEVTYPYTLKKNETAVAPNGVTYRFDVADKRRYKYGKSFCKKSCGEERSDVCFDVKNCL